MAVNANSQLNPLANPKGIKLLCELCQKPAFIQCTKCRVTYYCGIEHQKADWLGIHEKICSSLIPLRTPIAFMSSEEQRQHAKEQLLSRQRSMIDLTRTTGQKLLFEGKHEEAVPAAMQSLRFSIDVHGLASIELVPSYLILGEASIGLGRLSQAEEYLSQAQWTVLKTPECSNAIKYKLYRNLGLLYAAKGEYTDALRHLADDIYHASEEFGTDDIRTAGGYFHMANVFYRQNRLDTAKSLFEKVTDIWYEYLHKLVLMRTEERDAAKDVILSPEEAKSEDEGLDEAQEAEAIQVLNSIYEINEASEVERDHHASTRIEYALAMLYFILNEPQAAKEFGRRSLVDSEQLEDKEISTSIVEFMKACDKSPSVIQ